MAKMQPGAASMFSMDGSTPWSRIACFMPASLCDSAFSSIRCWRSHFSLSFVNVDRRGQTARNALIAKNNHICETLIWLDWSKMPTDDRRRRRRRHRHHHHHLLEPRNGSNARGRETATHGGAKRPKRQRTGARRADQFVFVCLAVARVSVALSIGFVLVWQLPAFVMRFFLFWPSPAFVLRFLSVLFFWVARLARHRAAPPPQAHL